MRLRNGPSAVIAALLIATQWPAEALAQDPVTKPTTTSTMRLRAPSAVVAVQQPDGTIAVRWSAVIGAASYQVTRSVPPTPQQVVASPTDTTYVDTNVQAGSTYYYVVGAVDSAGAIGMKFGSAPITAKLSSTTDGGSTSGGAPPATPTKILAQSISRGYVTLYWRFTQSGMSYRIERAVAASSPVWQNRQTTSPLPCCFSAVGDSAAPPASGQGYIYRVFTVDPAAPTRASAPLQSNTVFTTVPFLTYQGGNYWVLPPTDVTAKTVKVGSNLLVPGAALSTDATVVAIVNGGNLVAKAAGVAYVFYASVGPEGRPIMDGILYTVVP
jgi:hypothetical protein